MKKLAYLLLICCAASHPAFAQDDAAAPATDSSSAASAAGELPPMEPKNKSSFTFDDSGRNPFWPIGWKPTTKKGGDAQDQGQSEISAALFNVSSITLDPSARFAIINGKVMGEGQVFGLQVGNQIYQITVKSIRDGRVILLRRDEEIDVPLRRR